MEIKTVEREESPQRDLSTDTGIRRHLEAAWVAHQPAGPDGDLITQNVKELHEATRRARSDGKEPRDFSDLRPEDRKRLAVRSAYTEERTKAANPQPKAGPQGAMHNQPPGTWSAESKALFNSLPDPVRRDVLREQNFNMNSFGPVLSKYKELQETLAPHRQTYAPHGLSDAQAVKRLFDWEAYIRANPQQALTQIASELGLLPQAQQPQQDEQSQYQQPQQYQQYQSDPAEIAQVLHEFSKDKPHFEQVRVTMGQLMQGGLAEDLQTAYDKAIKLHPEIAAKDERKRIAAVSPSGRSPSAAPTNTKHRSGIRGSIKDAFDEARGRM